MTNKFDLDLKIGQAAEQTLAELLGNTKVEVKSEFGHWKRTGNVAIEYECNGKPSGLSVTQSDWWAMCFFENASLKMVIMIDVIKLKNLCRVLFKDKSNHKTVGDGGKVKALIVPIQKIIELARL